MVAEVEKRDPSFFGRVGTPPLSEDEVVETRLAPAGVGALAPLQAFDASLEGRTSRLIDWSARAPQVVADAVRHVLGAPPSSATARRWRWRSTPPTTPTGSSASTSRPTRR